MTDMFVEGAENIELQVRFRLENGDFQEGWLKLADIIALITAIQQSPNPPSLKVVEERDETTKTESD